MLHLIPAPLHRRLYRLAFRLRRRWLRLRGGTIYGCSVVARDGEGRVLLVRHSYGKGGWEFPGGGRGRGEPAEMAARREFAEELGCDLTEVVHLGRLEEWYNGATNMVDVFTGRIDGTPRADMREIVDVRLFAAEDLPEQLSAPVMRRLALIGLR